MFDLIADVERYPEFVPLCRSLTVRKRIPEPEVEIVAADMTVAYKLCTKVSSAGSRSTERTCRSWSNISRVRSS
jgi:ribosome-associated toxin RatA of RatAB toxin-antitoxin module